MPYYNSMFQLIRQLIFKLSPENAHHFTMVFLQFLTHIPGAFWLIRAFSGISNKGQTPIHLAGLTFPNPIGLAAGFDKDAKYLKVWKALGFGHVEIGTVTPLPQSGNPTPRLFRLPMDMALINRMGFNNEGAQAVVNRLKKRPEGLIVGGNIGKNKVTPNEEAALDYEKCFRALYSYVDYFCINVSSPNTPGLRDLQSIKELELIVNPILRVREELYKTAQRTVPICVKFAPDLTHEQLLEIIQFVNETSLDGIVLTNTTISREGLKTPTDIVSSIGPGGLSGMPLSKHSTEVLAKAKEMLHPSKFAIGVGGIYHGNDALAKKQAGANLVQIYSGFVYKGPALIGSVMKFWAKG